eukprot:7503794-Lingulodinium_polyedra.AAC.1
MDPRGRWRKRTPNDSVDVAGLCHALGKYASLKRPPFDFEMKHYAKARRSQGPDRDGLAMCKLLLICVLQYAFGGFPGL